MRRRDDLVPRNRRNAVPLLPPGAGRIPLMNPLCEPPHSLESKSSFVFSIDLWSLRAQVDGVVNRDLRDVGGIVGRPTEAVHDRREGEELLPFPRGDVMGESIDQFLMPREVVDGLVRSVDVRGQEGG